jgi:hypothetical protein
VTAYILKRKEFQDIAIFSMERLVSPGYLIWL